MTKRAKTRAPSRAVSITDDQLVEVQEVSAYRTLQMAVLESVTHVGAATSAIAAAGHVVVTSASGKDSLDKMRQVIASGTVDAVLVGLPGGEPAIEAALALAPTRPIVIAACTGNAIDGVARAAAARADLVAMRPHDPERLAPVLLAAARLYDETRSATTARGSEAVLRARLDALVEPEPGALQPFELFQRVLELELKRARRYEYAIAVALFSVEIEDEHGDDAPPPPGIRGILRARAGNALIHSIRDVDLATELDSDRFLVLLPYTDLRRATEVARRILAAVAANPPVIAAGRTFPCRVVGAIAGALPGQPLSFARLMRDATRALEQARRDGAELAVPILPLEPR